MAGAKQYFLRIDDLSRARGADPELSFEGNSAASFAAALLAALRDASLFQVWRRKQEDPDDVDPALGAVDANATVAADPANTGGGADISATTMLPHAVVRHRLQLLAGSSWTLRDVRNA